ncbi:glycosyl transferase-like sugar-binding protein [Ruminiclostridium sufflavum DSM 19573]|uniref:Glycosyl transferase-like sugar-binding protein n=1 Tax=Ruminiclostridium sufflavum DSM 19573 TaxID=1121337 RepID=A0A318XSY0_9FIRM|nr:glycosyltransferase [Ruminiclostridium sufflavum]PYG89471.1 glycosyl transferase-like sugar-binding protein [Ruminiclostridium sufflavum DSM 19573]
MTNIPKIIHYCWFGGSPLPISAEKCIASWRKYCPDYKIIEWNDKNFDYNCNQYVSEAYQAKKWAFVSDYARLHALNEYGGIYMDTDVELLKNLEPLLSCNAFSGFENNDSVQTAVMGASENNSWIKMLLGYYENRSFIKEDGSCDLTTNVVTITSLAKEAYNIRPDNSMQASEDNTVFYPSEYFSPKNFETGEIKITHNTYCIHHYDASWLSTGKKIKHFCTSKLKILMGQERVARFKNCLKIKRVL